MKLIVGLGNPGDKYENTKHNVGFKVVDAFCTKHNITLNKEKFNGIFYKGDDFIIAKPMTFMNLSGDFVQAIAKFFKINTEDILIIYDDMDFKPGTAVIRQKGSSGGQNGIKDVMNKLGTQEVSRIKVGIGRGTKIATDQVLSNFSKSDIEKLNAIKDHLVGSIDEFIKGDIKSAMNKFNPKMK